MFFSLSSSLYLSIPLSYPSVCYISSFSLSLFLFSSTLPDSAFLFPSLPLSYSNFLSFSLNSSLFLFASSSSLFLSLSLLFYLYLHLNIFPHYCFLYLSLPLTVSASSSLFLSLSLSSPQSL